MYEHSLETERALEPLREKITLLETLLDGEQKARKMLSQELRSATEPRRGDAQTIAYLNGLIMDLRLDLKREREVRHGLTELFAVRLNHDNRDILDDMEVGGALLFEYCGEIGFALRNTFQHFGVDARKAIAASRALDEEEKP